MDTKWKIIYIVMYINEILTQNQLYSDVDE